MAHTSVNYPSGIQLNAGNAANIAAVAGALILGLVGMCLIAFLSLRGAPSTGTPNQIDQARGVAPQYPPATPAEPRTWR